MDTISLQGKTHFFEKWESKYTKSGVNTTRDPKKSHVLSWWTVLKACNKSHLPIFLHLSSTYLAMLPKLACTPSGCTPRTWFSLAWQF
jgi:hypothetical protein